MPIPPPAPTSQVSHTRTPPSDLDPENLASETPKSSTTTLSAPRSAGGRASRTPKRYGTQSVTLSSVDDSLGPLGPLGNSFPSVGADEPPAPPQKEQAAAASPGPATATASTTSSLRGMMESVNLDDDIDEAEPFSKGPRVPPPVQPPSGEQVKRQVQPSVSVEQAAKPTFSIYVGDPHKVGDLTSSHTVYQVRTQVYCYFICYSFLIFAPAYALGVFLVKVGFFFC